jgi:hypothetical protein
VTSRIYRSAGAQSFGGDHRGRFVTSRIFRSAGAQCFRDAHRGRVCVRVFIGVSVRAYCEHLRPSTTRRHG